MEDEWVLNLRPFVAYSILAGWKFKTPFYISNPSLHKYRIIKSHLILMDYKELCWRNIAGTLFSEILMADFKY